MLVDSLRHQTMQDYELIIIDDYEGDRLGIVTRYLQGNGVEVKHVLRSKPKCFPELRYNFINAWNTGVMASTGDVLLFLQDYTWLAPRCLERWMTYEEVFREGYSVSGIGEFWVTEPPGVEKDFTHPLSLWKTPWRGSPRDNGWKDPSRWVGNPFEMFYVAVPYDLLVAINGFQECIDCNPAVLVTPAFMERARMAGGRFLIDHVNMCEMINHRNWSPRGLWHGIKEKADGSIVYHPRENCFNLKSHMRGNIFWELDEV